MEKFVKGEYTIEEAERKLHFFFKLENEYVLKNKINEKDIIFCMGAGKLDRFAKKLIQYIDYHMLIYNYLDRFILYIIVSILSKLYII